VPSIRWTIIAPPASDAPTAMAAAGRPTVADGAAGPYGQVAKVAVSAVRTGNCPCPLP
jgi:hypothetical protein